MRILVVEDNKTSLMILSRVISRIDGCEPLPFSSPETGLERAVQDGCELVIVDYVMPGMNGIEFITALRKHPHTRDIPVIMVTADSDDDVRKSARAAGATEFLTKPVDPLVLRALVRDLTTIYRTSPEDYDIRSKLGVDAA